MIFKGMCMHLIEMEVRDSELDAQSVVNNSYYFVYMAHARHKYVHEIGIDFVEMTRNGQNLFLISSNIEFKQPLISGDTFVVESKLVAEGKVRFAFQQKIIKRDGTLVASGYNICVCIDENNRRRPYLPEKIKVLIQDEI